MLGRVLDSDEIVVGTVGGKLFDFKDPQGDVEYGDELGSKDVTVETFDGNLLNSNDPRDGFFEHGRELRVPSSAQVHVLHRVHGTVSRRGFICW